MLVVYAGASWIILEVTGVFIEQLGLPPWFFPGAILLLIIGLVVILATAWVQSRPSPESVADQPTPWEVDLVDLRQSVTRGRLPHLNWARAILGGVFAFSLLFGFAGLYVLLTGEAPSLPGPKEAEAAAAPGIAVLPFRVVGQDLELWREGMVDLLSTNLDGAAGFRTSDPRTLLNRWRRQVGEGLDHPDLDVALEIARSVDASYAIMGSAVDLGTGVRLSAEVYDLATGDRIGRARLEGSADSVLVLVDRLSIDLFREIAELGPQELPDFDVREVTTTSLPALKAYLAGEQKFRRGQWDEAAAEYSRAIEEDSTFALALTRLSRAYGWTEGFSTRVLELSERAARHADRLPTRAALLVRANAELDEGRRSSIETLEELTARYPDDVEAHHSLGEAYYHLGGRALHTLDEAREAFRKAIELDPSYSPAYIHLIEDAFHRRDSADVRALLETYRGYSPASPQAVASSLLRDLAWGDAQEREAARVALDTASASTLNDIAFHATIAGAYPWEAALLAARERAEDRHPDDGHEGHLRLFHEFTQRGRLEESRDALVEFLIGQWGYPPPVAEDAASIWFSLLGYPTPEPSRELSSFPNEFARWTHAVHAADDGRTSILDEAITAYETEAEAAAAAGNEPRRLNQGSFAQGLRVYRALARGDVEAAAAEYRKPMPRAAPWMIGLLRYSIGKAYLEQGNAAEAVPYLRSLSTFFEVHVPSQYYLGEAYEALGDREKARLNYASFLRWWEEADSELEPWKDRAREALERLTRESRVE